MGKLEIDKTQSDGAVGEWLLQARKMVEKRAAAKVEDK